MDANVAQQIDASQAPAPFAIGPERPTLPPILPTAAMPPLATRRVAKSKQVLTDQVTKWRLRVGHNVPWQSAVRGISPLFTTWDQYENIGSGTFGTAWMVQRGSEIRVIKVRTQSRTTCLTSACSNPRLDRVTQWKRVPRFGLVVCAVGRPKRAVLVGLTGSHLVCTGDLAQ